MHVASSSRPRLPQSAEKALLRRPFSHLQRTDKPRPPHPTSHKNYKTVYQPARDFATACQATLDHLTPHPRGHLDDRFDHESARSVQRGLSLWCVLDARREDPLTRVTRLTGPSSRDPRTRVPVRGGQESSCGLLRTNQSLTTLVALTVETELEDSLGEQLRTVARVVLAEPELRRQALEAARHRALGEARAVGDLLPRGRPAGQRAGSAIRADQRRGDLELVARQRDRGRGGDLGARRADHGRNRHSQPRRAEQERVAVGQPRGTLEPATVEEGAVRRAEVGGDERGTVARDLQMRGRHASVVDADVTLLAAPDDGRLVTERDHCKRLS